MDKKYKMEILGDDGHIILRENILSLNELIMASRSSISLHTRIVIISRESYAYEELII